jgi:hypothetical protein
LQDAFSMTSSPRCGDTVVVGGCCTGGGVCTGGGFGCVVRLVVVVVVVDVVVLTVISARSGVGTMLTDWVVLVLCASEDGEEDTGLESKLHPA